MPYHISTAFSPHGKIHSRSQEVACVASAACHGGVAMKAVHGTGPTGPVWLKLHGTLESELFDGTRVQSHCMDLHGTLIESGNQSNSGILDSRF